MENDKRRSTGISLFIRLRMLMIMSIVIIIATGITGILFCWQNNAISSGSGPYSLSIITSLSFVLLASALLVKIRRGKGATIFVSAVALLVIVLAGMNLIARFNTTNWLGLDSYFKLQGGIASLSSNASILFLLSGISLYTIDLRKAFLSQSLSLITASISLLTLIGHIHHMPEFYVPFQNSFITIPASICFLLLSLSFLLAGSNKGYMAEITSPYGGGQMARRLLPMLLFTPLILEVIRLYGEVSGYYSSAFGIVLFFCAVLGIFVFTILSSVKLANKIDLTLKSEIDERQKAEVELKKSHRFLETILENIPNMIFVKEGKDLRFAAINKEGERLLGIPRQDYIGKTDDDFFPTEQAAFFKQKDSEVFNSESIMIIEEEPVMTKDGERWLRTKKIPVKDANGLPLYLVGISEDITEKRIQDEKIKQFYAELENKVKERTLALSTSEKRFRALIENSTDGITKTGADSQILYESPAVERMTGHTLTEKVGSFFFDHIYPEDLIKCKNLYEELFLNPGKTIFRQFRITHQNGNYIWVEGTAINLLSDQSVRAIIFNYRDITERKKHEQEREVLIQQLTKHNKDLRQFSYITSHNLRAPVSNLLGLLGLLDYTPVQDPSLKEIINGFSISTNSLNDTINDLLSILHIKENTETKLEDINISELFNKILGQVSTQIADVEPELDIDFKAESNIFFNRAYLESIFLNLLTNAIKYRSNQRRLKLIVRMVELEDKSVVTFEDNGIGLDLELCKTKVFGLYQRFHNHPDSKGLGLYLVKTHMEAHGGSIEIESTVEVGTKFTLTFNKIYAEQGAFH